MSSVSGVLKATEVLLRVIDLYEAGTIGIEEFREARTRIERRLEAAREKGKDLTWEEVDEANQALGDAIKNARR